MSEVPATQTGEETTPQAPSQERTEAEKATYNLKKKAEEAKALGIDIADVLGIKPNIKIDESISDDTQLTVGMYREVQKQDAKKTALQMADEIEDEDEKKRVKEILTRLAPSGDATADLALARGSVNSTKNTMIAEELARKGKPATHASNPGASGKGPEDIFEPTADEAAMMRPPFNLTQEDVLKARKKSQ